MASGVAGALTGALVFGVFALAGVAASPSAHADDAQSVTVTAAQQDPDVENAPFPDLAITVSQTSGLVSQGLEISWTGGKESSPPTQQTGGENFLQFAQCWGDAPDGGPDRETCQYGAFLTPGATRDGNRSEGTVAPEDAAFSTPANGFLSPAYSAVPFRSVTGETVAAVVGGAKVPGVSVNTNEFFTQFTSNEIPWAGSASNGEGSTKFEVQTAVQSRGLGCGSRVTATDGSVTGASCWLVAIPRGTADAGESAIIKSGLFWDTWKHRLAVRLDFRPLGLSCTIGAAERHLAGSELAATAIASWQPTLCGAQGGDAYTLLTGPESDASVAANGTIPAPLALTSRPLAPDITDKLSYAPVALTGVTVSFAIDRLPKVDGTVPPEYAAKARLPFESMKLTPRLIAKLLTSSYRDALPFDADRSHLGHTAGTAFVPNPRNLLFDPDFLEVNADDPEWSQQAIANVSLSDMIVPQGRSDAAYALWSYVMADAEARAFLAGAPDPWGMVVNKWSSTDGAINPTQNGVELPREDFPKADPSEVAAVPQGPAAINTVTWRPYTNTLDTAGYLTLRGDGLVLGAWDAFGNPPKYVKTPRNLPGSQGVIGLTDTAAAAKYQIVTTSLLNPAGQFVAPSTESIAAAAAAMTASSTQPQVYGFDFSSSRAQGAPAAYPLAMPVYAAVNPAMTDARLRASYATFIRYAASTGQTPGVALGQLPEGYAPLPEGWRTQAVAAADAIQAGTPAKSPVRGSVQSTGQAPRTAATGLTPSSSTAGGSPVPADGAPEATGEAATALSGATTPDDPELVGVQAALPISLLAGLAGAAAVPLIPRFRQRR
ncbi:hypothetical protein DCE93_12990 [Agromyces badenianii]|uniref:Uncharacterized protein n=2 Tax=Agromyces badenianii TaxID=2080742 RepID=A0A2S0WYV7_9MICO|nr:hypothetical protein DCE93_12990 [Agromyces badenianii]PWC05308.1 hypothetical protein DCE94_03200 [Agromyces badenianii]